MTVTKLEGKSIEDTVKHPHMNIAMWSRYPSIMVGNDNPPSSHNGSRISGDSEVSSVYTCFACGTDGHISRFCSQMQSLADHGPDNNILYPHGPPLLVNRDSHEQSMQALTHGHLVEKRGQTLYSTTC